MNTIQERVLKLKMNLLKLNAEIMDAEDKDIIRTAIITNAFNQTIADTLEQVSEIHKRWEGKADSQLLRELEGLLTPLTDDKK